MGVNTSVSRGLMGVHNISVSRGITGVKGPPGFNNLRQLLHTVNEGSSLWIHGIRPS
jgi:hypothetical protein